MNTVYAIVYKYDKKYLVPKVKKVNESGAR